MLRKTLYQVFILRYSFYRVSVIPSYLQHSQMSSSLLVPHSVSVHLNEMTPYGHETAPLYLNRCEIKLRTPHPLRARSLRPQGQAAALHMQRSAGTTAPLHLQCCGIQL